MSSLAELQDLDYGYDPDDWRGIVQVRSIAEKYLVVDMAAEGIIERRSSPLHRVTLVSKCPYDRHSSVLIDHVVWDFMKCNKCHSYMSLDGPNDSARCNCGDCFAHGKFRKGSILSVYDIIEGKND